MRTAPHNGRQRRVRLGMKARHATMQRTPCAIAAALVRHAAHGRWLYAAHGRERWRAGRRRRRLHAASGSTDGVSDARSAAQRSAAAGAPRNESPARNRVSHAMHHRSSARAARSAWALALRSARERWRAGRRRRRLHVNRMPKARPHLQQPREDARRRCRCGRVRRRRCSHHRIGAPRKGQRRMGRPNRTASQEGSGCAGGRKPDGKDRRVGKGCLAGGGMGRREDAGYLGAH
jgi:hypothetical protein